MIKFGSGICKVTIVDKETGEALFSADCLLTHYSTHIKANPVELVGQSAFTDLLFAPQIDLTMQLRVLSDAHKEPENARPDYLGRQNNCDHQWIRYEGFTQQYDYCKICDTRRS